MPAVIFFACLDLEQKILIYGWTQDKNFYHKNTKYNKRKPYLLFRAFVIV
jgi:hypothetical protein